MRLPAIALSTIFVFGLAGNITPAAAQGTTTGKTTTGKTATGKNPNATASKPAAQPQTSTAAATPALGDLRSKASYALGMNIGNNLRGQMIDVDPDLLARGLKDGLTGGKTLMTEDQMRDALTQFGASVRAKQEEKKKEEGEANKKEGETFLAANKTKEGVVTLPSGLQYKIITQGTGPKPTAADTVVCNYRGTLINGTEFDSSYKRGEPSSFPVSGVIKGWTEALQLMPAGSKWQLFVPPDLAYGERGAGADIGPNATLIFEVELVSIQPKETQPKEQPK